MVWTVLIVDSQPIFREGLAAALVRDGGFEIVGEAAGATAACELAESLQPAVISIDVALAGESGIGVAREVMRRAPSTRILVITEHLGEQYVVQALAAGVRGYVGKEQPVADVVRALRLVAQGESCLSPTISRYVLDQFVRMHSTGRSGPLLALTPRERDIFDLTVRGTPAELIARRLGISRRTVDTHRTRVMRKLEVHSVADLVRLASRLGVLDEPPVPALAGA